jgi:hypothetical protein
VCNPQGYAGYELTLGFDPCLIIEIASGTGTRKPRPLFDLRFHFITSFEAPKSARKHPSAPSLRGRAHGADATGC